MLVLAADSPGKKRSVLFIKGDIASSCMRLKAKSIPYKAQMKQTRSLKYNFLIYLLLRWKWRLFCVSYKLFHTNLTVLCKETSSLSKLLSPMLRNPDYFVWLKNAWICWARLRPTTPSSSWREALQSWRIFPKFSRRRSAFVFPTPGICWTVWSTDGSNNLVHFLLWKGWLVLVCSCTWNES